MDPIRQSPTRGAARPPARRCPGKEIRLSSNERRPLAPGADQRTVALEPSQPHPCVGTGNPELARHVGGSHGNAEKSTDSAPDHKPEQLLRSRVRIEPGQRRGRRDRQVLRLDDVARFDLRSPAAPLPFPTQRPGTPWRPPGGAVSTRRWTARKPRAAAAERSASEQRPSPVAEPDPTPRAVADSAVDSEAGASLRPSSDTVSSRMAWVLGERASFIAAPSLGERPRGTRLPAPCEWVCPRHGEGPAHRSCLPTQPGRPPRLQPQRGESRPWDP